MSEIQNLSFLRQAEATLNISNIKAILAIAILGSLLAACAPKVWATQSQREIKVKMQIQSDGDVRIDPEMMQNTVLNVRSEDGTSTNLSDNQDIPLTYSVMDVDPEKLNDLEFETYLLDEQEGYTDARKCVVKDDELNILPNGYLELILLCTTLQP